MVPPIVNALFDTYKKSQRTKAASMSSRPQLDLLFQTHARLPVEPALNIQFVDVAVRRTTLQPSKVAPGTGQPETSPLIFRGTLSDPGSFVSFPVQPTVPAPEDLEGVNRSTGVVKRTSRNDHLCHTCGLLYSDTEFSHLLLSRDEETGRVSSGARPCPVPIERRKTPEEIKKLVSGKKRGKKRSAHDASAADNVGTGDNRPPSQRVRMDLPSTTPVQPPMPPPSSTNGESCSIFPVHGIRNDTAKFCYQTPFLQLLFTTLTENDISAWKTVAAASLLSKSFFAHLHPVLNAYKSNLLINNPTDEAGSDHAHCLLKALRNFFTTCSPANFPQDAQAG